LPLAEILATKTIDFIISGYLDARYKLTPPPVDHPRRQGFLIYRD
jgi:hypothetical protein